MCAAKRCDCLSYNTLLILAYPWAGLQDKLACTQRLVRSLCSHPNPFSFGKITGRDPTYRWGLSPGPQELCRVEELQHQLAHQCSPNIIGIWEWGICGLMGGAFIT